MVKPGRQPTPELLNKACPYCKSSRISKHGFVYRSTGKRQLYVCNDSEHPETSPVTFYEPIEIKPQEVKIKA
jgi:hypothetical protein